METNQVVAVLGLGDLELGAHEPKHALQRHVVAHRREHLQRVHRVLNKRAKSPQGPGWAMRRGMYVHGRPTPFDYLVESKRYTLEEFAANIKCPTLVCRAESDLIGGTAPALFAALTGAAKKEYVTFLAAEGAGEHCEGGARSVFNATMFAFLDAAMPEN